VSGGVYPAFGLVFALTIESFQATDPHERRVEGDRNALYFFIIAIVATLTMGIQVYLFSMAAARLTSKLRSLSFKAILRQDSKPTLTVTRMSPY
jgi:ATP-binding cassette subfamily B (MDR/TAP) protein 1